MTNAKLTLPLSPSVDTVISCIVCGGPSDGVRAPPCDFEIKVGTSRGSAFHGIHEGCIPRAGVYSAAPPSEQVRTNCEACGTAIDGEAREVNGPPFRIHEPKVCRDVLRAEVEKLTTALNEWSSDCHENHTSCERAELAEAEVEKLTKESATRLDIATQVLARERGLLNDLAEAGAEVAKLRAALATSRQLEEEHFRALKAADEHIEKLRAELATLHAVSTDYWATNNDGHSCARDGDECDGCRLQDALNSTNQRLRKAGE